jgi:hypothetical protein
MRRSGRIALCVLMIGLVASVAMAFVGDDDDLTDKAQKEPRPKRRIVNVQPLAANVDSWIYGDSDQGEAPQDRLESLLRRKVEEISRIAAISANQKQKLILAGRGDIQRFVDRVDRLKAKYQTGGNANQAFSEVGPLRADARGRLFEGDSLFAKTLAKLLTPEQLAGYTATDDDRRRFQHRAGVHMTVLRLSTAIGLSNEQWKRLEDLLLKETRPARIFDRVYPAAYFNIVYVQMPRIPEEKLKPLFEPWQWRALKQKLDEASGFAAGLQGNGIVLEAEPGPDELRGPTRRRALRFDNPFEATK